MLSNFAPAGKKFVGKLFTPFTAIHRTKFDTAHGAGCSLPLFLKQGAAAGAPVCDRLKPFSRPAAFNISLVAATVGGWTR
jgi:hypothetical protein